MENLIDSPLKGDILIVDDTPQNLRLLMQILTENGHRARPAISGQVALQAIRNRVPNLILLDIVMPEMDGFQLCEILKADPSTREVPIIFISALDAVDDKVRAFAAGGVDYVTKPFQPQEVLARVGAHLALRESHQRLERANAELEAALAEVKALRGLLPVCSYCKRFREEGADPRLQESWVSMEEYLSRHTDADLTHGVCPDCAQELLAQVRATPSSGAASGEGQGE